MDASAEMRPGRALVERLLARASVPPRLLGPPAPSPEDLALAAAAALRAPDHGRLRPWRFVLIAGEARAALGGLLAESLARRDPDASPERLDLERAKPLRAPLVVAAGAALRHDHPSVPVWEQQASAAAGTMNFLNALDALGHGAIWLSSGALEDAAVKRALGFAASDMLLGWLYVGTPAPERPRPARPDPQDVLRIWTPQAMS
ncbi:MAG: nitroreductase [Acetobacteraceae bacterium]|nr:nitroreductase [Acetobacteraceae bacterium]